MSQKERKSVRGGEADDSQRKEDSTAQPDAVGRAVMWLLMSSSTAGGGAATAEKTEKTMVSETMPCDASRIERHHRLFPRLMALAPTNYPTHRRPNKSPRSSLCPDSFQVFPPISPHLPSRSSVSLSLSLFVFLLYLSIFTFIRTARRAAPLSSSLQLLPRTRDDGGKRRQEDEEESRPHVMSSNGRRAEPHGAAQSRFRG